MFRLIKRMAAVSAMLALVLSVLAGVSTSAQAATNDDEVRFTLNLDISDIADAQSSFDYESKSIVKSGVNDRGLPVFTPVNAPSAHWKMANAKRCVTLKKYPNSKKIRTLHRRPTVFKLKGAALSQFRRAAMSDKVIGKKKGGKTKVTASCFWLPSGAEFPDTVKDITGAVRGIGNSVKGGKPMLFEVAKVTSRRQGESTEALVPIRRGQDFDGDGVIDDGDCGNLKPAVIEYPEGTYEYNDSDEFWWKDSGNVNARVHVGGSATISQGNCAMTLNYDFFANGAAGYSVVVKGKTEVEAHGRVVKIVSNQEAHAAAVTSAETAIKGELEAVFTGCNTPTTPTTPAPRVTPPTVNDFVVNQTGTVTFTGKLAKGLSGTATASAGTGTIVGGSRKSLQVDENGYFSVTFTYTAGDEPGRDTVTVTIDQSDGQSVVDTTKGRDGEGNPVNDFAILPRPITPA